MKTFYPEYYKNFHCIAENCPDTCCSQWEIDVDKETYQFYQQCEGSVKKQIHSNMNQNNDGCKLTENGNACPFYTNDRLCQIYITLGEEHMPAVCKMYPRFFMEYGARRETLLSPSCPEAAKLLLMQTEPIELTCIQENISPQPNDIDASLFYFLLDVRDAALKIIQYQNESILSRIEKLLAFGEYVQSSLEQECFHIAEDTVLKPSPFIFDQKEAWNVLKKAQLLTDRWKNALNISFEQRKCSETEAENILVYFILHYFLTAVYDGRILDKIRFGVLSFYIVETISGAFSDLSDALYLYSREILHNDENVRLLQKKSDKILQTEETKGQCPNKK